MTNPSSRTTLPDRPPDPDYSELWDVADKLNQLLSALVAGGASTEVALILAGASETESLALRFDPREVEILAMLAGGEVLVGR